MILVSQDKKKIINFERIAEVIVSDEDICVSNNFEVQKGLIIATYESEERAKEVLQEITEKICESSNIKMDIEGINCVVSKQIYYMPEM